MHVRVPTPASMVLDRAAGAIAVVALALALFSPLAFAGVLTAIPLIAFAALTPKSIARQRKGEANPALVSPAERRAFIIKDTALVVVMISGIGAVFYLVFTSQPVFVKVGFGLLALILATVAGYLRGPLGIEHAAKIFPAN